MVVRRIRASTRFISRVRKTKKSEKKSVFLKNEGDNDQLPEKYFNRRSASRMRIFRLYIAKKYSVPFDGQMQKTRKSVTSGRFGAFPDLWRHTQREFLSVIIDLAYRPNETFCSRMHRFGCGSWISIGWKGWKVHRKDDYHAAHFEFCRRPWPPPGHPWRLRPNQATLDQRRDW